MIRALIAEDEPLARHALRDLIEGVAWLELVGEAEDGAAAVRMIDALAPDLVFLDVQMPELSGLEVLGTIENQPAVVFTTAFDRYAVAAFELEAIDYLVKPFGRRRFRATLERVRSRLDDPDGGVPSVKHLRSALERGPLSRLFARSGDRIVPIRIESVSLFTAADDYVEVHTDGGTHLVSLTLGDLETRLDQERFIRVHRSAIVNLDQIHLMRPFDDRRLVITMEGGARVVASRSGSKKLRQLIN